MGVPAYTASAPSFAALCPRRRGHPIGALEEPCRWTHRLVLHGRGHEARLRGPAHDHPGRVASPGADPSRHFNIPPQPIAKTEDRAVPSPDTGRSRSASSRRTRRPAPILVHYHGGGWVIGSVDQSDNLCRAMANATPCIVVSVEYRLAPRPVLGGLEDCYAATKWVAEHGAELGGDPSRLAVGGESAGRQPGRRRRAARPRARRPRDLLPGADLPGSPTRASRPPRTSRWPKGTA